MSAIAGQSAGRNCWNILGNQYSFKGIIGWFEGF